MWFFLDTSLLYSLTLRQGIQPPRSPDYKGVPLKNVLNRFGCMIFSLYDWEPAQSDLGQSWYYYGLLNDFYPCVYIQIIFSKGNMVHMEYLNCSVLFTGDHKQNLTVFQVILYGYESKAANLY